MNLKNDIKPYLDKNEIFSFGEKLTIISIYLNRYGCQIGVLVRHSDGQISSWDPFIWEEFLSQ